MTNRTDTQLTTLAERAIDLFYDDDIIDTATMNLFIDGAGMDYNDDLSTRDALANAIAFDLAEQLEDDDDLFYDTLDIDALADRIADLLIARF